MRTKKGYVTADPISLDTDVPTVPTRRCLVCDDFENPFAKIICEDKPWLCPKCKSVLGFLVEETINGGRDE